MVCCLNPDCQNPLHPDGTKLCQSCGTQLVLLKNRYHPIKPLGRGGFGITYLAEDLDKLNERCVIKQLAPKVQGSWAIQKAKELFEQEARRLQQLGENPQIPTLFAYFEQDNYLYLVQQYIEGQTLDKELARQGVFSEPKIRKLLFNLLELLKCVHQHQVIHRDIKPENIIRRQSDGKLVLIDFGVAKQLTKTSIAKPGTTIGSFGYAPIEQMQGGEAYPSSDLYSLGATCFHLLSGIHPRELWNRQGCGWVSGWRQHLKPALNQELSQIIDRLLQANHQQRYQSAEEVLRDLNSQTVPSPPSVSSTSTTVPLPTQTPSPPSVSSTYPSLPAPTQTQPPSPPNKSPLLLIGGVGIAAALVLTFSFLARTPQLGDNGKTQPPPPLPQPTPIISPVTGVDYTPLRNLLAAGKWKEADQETTRAMLQAAGREKEGYFTIEDIDDLSCEDLRIIDQLWRQSSKGKFGFSVQKDIYQGVGDTQGWKEQWRNFANRVGWELDGNGQEILESYDDLTFNLNAPKGQLPASIDNLTGPSLFSRTTVCNL